MIFGKKHKTMKIGGKIPLIHPVKKRMPHQVKYTEGRIANAFRYSKLKSKKAFGY